MSGNPAPIFSEPKASKGPNILSDNDHIVRIIWGGGGGLKWRLPVGLDYEATGPRRSGLSQIVEAVYATFGSLRGFMESHPETFALKGRTEASPIPEMICHWIQARV